ncbi:hypothetical protein ACL02T_28235 [Pseudonocardia sp. RS010]|uniref:hypothetical protein n=1 Tax=Pseudonocardia sp. RS010 TaxID=3385979 RepID=UPI0039A19FDA
MSNAADAQVAAPEQAADSVIWEQVISRTNEDLGLTVTFQIFLAIACLLAAIGR